MKQEKYEQVFEIGDIVIANDDDGFPLHVTGYIHDDSRLFVTDLSNRLNNGKEYEIYFVEVTAHYRKIK